MITADLNQLKMFWKFQLDALRKNVVGDGNDLADNYRPTQGLGSRTVYHFDADEEIQEQSEWVDEKKCEEVGTVKMDQQQ